MKQWMNVLMIAGAFSFASSANEAAPNDQDYGKIPVVVALWEHTNFGGRKVLLAKDTPELSSYGFNDLASAVGVHPGPSIEGTDWVVTLYENANYEGKEIHVGLGTHASLPDLGFNDCASSLKIWRIGKADWPGTAHHGGEVGTIKPIPFVVELFEHADFKGRHVLIFENTAALGDLGMNDRVSSIRIRRGPDYQAEGRVTLFRDSKFAGSTVTLAEGDYPNLGDKSFNDAASSIRIGG